MSHQQFRLPKSLLAFLLSGTLVVFAEPLPQVPQDAGQSSPPQVPDEHSATQVLPPNAGETPTSVSGGHELPDAPTPSQSVPQNQQNSTSQQQNPNSVPSGAAGAKAPTVKGAPASRPIGAAIAPAKQRQRRSLLIKVGLIAGAGVAVGTAFALSKGSPSKPPGAP
jgi:hypothetical protein